MQPLTFRRARTAVGAMSELFALRWWTSTARTSWPTRAGAVRTNSLAIGDTDEENGAIHSSKRGKNSSAMARNSMTRPARSLSQRPVVSDKRRQLSVTTATITITASSNM